MTCATPYLLRTQAQIDAFKERHAALIREKGPELARWFNGLPLYRWTRLQLRTGQEEATVGLLCILYLQGDINITFSRDGDYIQREALSPEEYQEWAQRSLKHPSK